MIVATIAASLVTAVPSSGAVAQKSTYRAQAWLIISHVFPPGTAQAAFRVASCETVGFTDFLNPSGAADLFQEMPGNDSRVFTYNGHSLKLNYQRLTRRDNGPPTWYAAQIAYLQSHGGTNWSEWVCKP